MLDALGQLLDMLGQRFDLGLLGLEQCQFAASSQRVGLLDRSLML